jgi:hypothetical protein
VSGLHGRGVSVFEVPPQRDQPAGVVEVVVAEVWSKWLWLMMTVSIALRSMPSSSAFLSTVSGRSPVSKSTV